MKQVLVVLSSSAAFAAMVGCVSPTADGSMANLKDFADLPAAAEPAVVARRLAEHFLETSADAYKGDRRPVTLVGINFRTVRRNIDEPLYAAL